MPIIRSFIYVICDLQSLKRKMGHFGSTFLEMEAPWDNEKWPQFDSNS